MHADHPLVISNKKNTSRKKRKSGKSISPLPAGKFRTGIISAEGEERGGSKKRREKGISKESSKGSSENYPEMIVLSIDKFDHSPVSSPRESPVKEKEELLAAGVEPERPSIVPVSGLKKIKRLGSPPPSERYSEAGSEQPEDHTPSVKFNDTPSTINPTSPRSRDESTPLSPRRLASSAVETSRRTIHETQSRDSDRRKKSPKPPPLDFPRSPPRTSPDGSPTVLSPKSSITTPPASPPPSKSLKRKTEQFSSEAFSYSHPSSSPAPTSPVRNRSHSRSRSQSAAPPPSATSSHYSPVARPGFVSPHRVSKPASDSIVPHVESTDQKGNQQSIPTVSTTRASVSHPHLFSSRGTTQPAPGVPSPHSSGHSSSHSSASSSPRHLHAITHRHLSESHDDISGRLKEGAAGKTPRGRAKSETEPVTILARKSSSPREDIEEENECEGCCRSCSCCLCLVAVFFFIHVTCSVTNLLDLTNNTKKETPIQTTRSERGLYVIYFVN